MLSLLSRLFSKKSSAIENQLKETEALEEKVAPAGFYQPQTATELLHTPRRRKFLTHIWQRTSLSREQFNLLYRKPIERYAALVQLFPASEAHHHAYPGGMLDHGLEIMAYALKLRQSYLLPIGSGPETQAEQAEVWSAGIAYAALLHDIGKVAVDLHVECESGYIWHPWYGELAAPYRFRYHAEREYRLHSAGTGLLYRQILDESILDWLSKTPELWSALLYVLAGSVEHAGVLGEIVSKADQASVAHELGGDPAKAMAAPKHALQRKLLDGLRYLVKEELQLNNAGPSDGWLTEDALWLVSKTVADKLRAHLLSQGISGIPDKNSAIFDVMIEHSLLLPTVAGKAIWSATVKSNETGWSTKFTFLKVSPAIIWEANRPQAFAGSVTAHVEAVESKPESTETEAIEENQTDDGTTEQKERLQQLQETNETAQPYLPSLSYETADSTRFVPSPVEHEQKFIMAGNERQISPIVQGESTTPADSLAAVLDLLGMSDVHTPLEEAEVEAETQVKEVSSDTIAKSVPTEVTQNSVAAPKQKTETAPKVTKEMEQPSKSVIPEPKSETGKLPLLKKAAEKSALPPLKIPEKNGKAKKPQSQPQPTKKAKQPATTKLELEPKPAAPKQTKSAEPISPKHSKPQIQAIAEETVIIGDTPSGEHFMQWLKNAILHQKLTINNPQALVHTVEDSIYIVTPGIFMRYVQEFPQAQLLAKQENLPAWRWIQQNFEQLKVHRKQDGGLNIWTCNVAVPGKPLTKKVHGYLLAHPETILPEIMFNNPYLTVIRHEGEV